MEKWFSYYNADIYLTQFVETSLYGGKIYRSPYLLIKYLRYNGLGNPKKCSGAKMYYKHRGDSILCCLCCPCTHSYEYDYYLLLINKKN